MLISLRFANGSEGTISYLANGDRAFSKERIEVFGGGSTAVLEDFRRLELVRNGRRDIVRARWQQDKGHRAEWAAFAESVQKHGEAPISFSELVSSALATVRIDEALGSGRRLAVNATELLDAARSADVSCTPQNE